ncbi:hypothetical protein K402DRAFT_417724 [Aulographum hederae CBS 113979]|uniref:Uncharacterized protein n=1 Tax=Aulographum hederae CBS 113979 TaxID=1176131 RepID=A0A6G1HAS9_9PEZI|nr:hypothetical protein K402DRAFT_417724 [Aulographum hederae CBS 113979]
MRFFTLLASAGTAAAVPQMMGAAQPTGSPMAGGMGGMPGMSGGGHEGMDMSGSAAPAPAAPAPVPGTDASTAIPAGVFIEPRLESTQMRDGGQRKDVPYGPFTVRPGGMASVPAIGRPPCQDCFITAMQANIVYLDGKEANINTGAWLHHMVVMKGVGPVFASGNERTPLRLNNKYKYGLEVGRTDMMSMIIDLMSNSKETITLRLVMSYEFIPKAQAIGYKDVYMRWNDVGQPSAREGVYKFKSMARSIPVSGTLLYTNGHVHDGGTDTRLFINNKEVCRSTMLYGRRPGFMEAEGAMEGGMEGMEGMEGMKKRDGGHGQHISDSSTCQDFGTIKTGDRMHIEAWYDSNKYPLMEHNGEKERLMGIMRVYIGS